MLICAFARLSGDYEMLPNFDNRPPFLDETVYASHHQSSADRHPACIPGLLSTNRTQGSSLAAWIYLHHHGHDHHHHHHTHAHTARLPAGPNLKFVLAPPRHAYACCSTPTFIGGRGKEARLATASVWCNTRFGWLLMTLLFAIAFNTVGNAERCTDSHCRLSLSTCHLPRLLILRC